ncbi:hypothetical protein M2354_000668 [Leclercia adecarboxylata]|jgi:hypothetical protein|nr:hypothetical protein [Leclercia adecarboxylata]SPX66320.1 Uncharacterised protein [Leclercia adecarboxylata]STX26376.1 Uncharacterised protein [Leclercia adecarboxylata]VTP66238.1 Uncharacterised protein [Leclercia adecarboxylata]
MTDVINGKNRKRRAGYKVVLPIFTQRLRDRASMKFSTTRHMQNEPRFVRINQIKLL